MCSSDLFTWTRTGNTLNYSISSATTYCGSTKTISSTTPITLTGYACSFVGTITGTVLQITSITSGSISVGQTLYGPGIAAGTTITGMGGAPGPSSGNTWTAPGTYQVSVSQTLSSTSFIGYTPNNNVVEIATIPPWTHAKDCCNGNQNNIAEYYILNMLTPSTIQLTATSAAGNQTGC